MSHLSRYLRRRSLIRRGYHLGRPEDLWRTLLARYVPGKSFADVGCMWRVSGEYSFFAAASGAAAVTGIDVNPATPEFLARNAAQPRPIGFVQADLNDPRLCERTGPFDVVFCSGVLYHVPNPVFSLEQLRRLCGQTLILTTASLADRPGLPNAAVLLAGLTDAQRASLNFQTRGKKKEGLDSPYEMTHGYANWVWLPTPECVRAMLILAGFSVVEFYPALRSTTVVAVPTAAVDWTPPKARAHP